MSDPVTSDERPAIAALPEPTPSRRRLAVGEPLPAVCELTDLEVLLGLGKSRVYDLYKRGAFNFALMTPAIDTKPRFSGSRLQAWRDGEPLEEPSPAPATRRYFGRSKGR